MVNEKTILKLIREEKYDYYFEEEVSGNEIKVNVHNSKDFFGKIKRGDVGWATLNPAGDKIWLNEWEPFADGKIEELSAEEIDMINAELADMEKPRPVPTSTEEVTTMHVGPEIKVRPNDQLDLTRTPSYRKSLSISHQAMSKVAVGLTELLYQSKDVKDIDRITVLKDFKFFRDNLMKEMEDNDLII